MDIVTYPHRILLEPTIPVADIDGQLQQLIDDMADTMYAAPGVGLAANQVGSSNRILIFDEMSDQEKRQYQVIINPKLIESEGELTSENEGCLSVPEFRSDVKRCARVLVEGVDRDGNPLRMEVEGFRAIVLQHEIDHLDGKLFIDRISPLKRQLYKRRVKKQQKMA
jgi:peptide deformylase